MLYCEVLLFGKEIKIRLYPECIFLNFFLRITLLQV